VDEIQIASEIDCERGTVGIASQQLRRPTKNQGWRPWGRWEKQLQSVPQLKAFGLQGAGEDNSGSPRSYFTGAGTGAMK
jgi:hypothetical protein